VSRAPITDISTFKIVQEEIVAYELGEIEVKSLIQVTLGPKDDLFIEIGVYDERQKLDDDKSRLMIERLIALRDELYREFAVAEEWRQLLEFKYYRDSFTDYLQRVTLRVDRYLLRDHFETIVSALKNKQLVHEEELASLRRIFEINEGRNLYYLLEKWRFTKARTEKEGD
jgi:hypothetical protein